MESRRPIPENPPRWQPNPDPALINVPGLDTSAPVLDQIEQMEQLITLKLQNIDANFSKIHHLLANKVLPALKRYAVATEPVREAAKVCKQRIVEFQAIANGIIQFWTSFYEQAAQIQIPTFDDHSTVNDESRQTEPVLEEQDPTLDPSSSHIDTSKHHHGYEPSITSSDGSFAPGQGAFSSTPATARMTRMYDPSSTETSDDPSWNASLDTPMVRRDPQSQQRSAMEDETILGPSMAEQVPSMRFDEPTPNPARSDRSRLPMSEKGKARDTKEPLLRNVLRHNLYPIDTSSAGSSSAATSPLKYRGKPKTPVPKKYNPFLSPDKDPSQWDGVVDLTDPSVMTPGRFGKPTYSKRGPKTPAQESDDDSFDGLPAGMSPPVMMSPARPPRSMAELGLLKLGQTPIRDASARITRDLVRDIYRSSHKKDGYLHSRTESTMSTMPTPPSLSRYHRHDDTSDSLAIDSSLESMMRRVGLDVPSSISTTGSTPGLRLRSHASLKATEPVLDALATPPPQHLVAQDEPITPMHEHEDLDSDSDSLDEINNTAHPSHAFLMASSGGREDSDDSFGSNQSSDSLDDEGADMGLPPIHPFAGTVEDDGFDDSYEDDMYDRLNGEVQEETLFGVPPQQRQALQQRSNVGGGHLGDELRMLGEDLLQDTIGIGTQIALSGRIEESPTPAVRPSTSR
ncbi:hypothetical protein DXG01_002107 [Tephrocybe rancida]|nr:hypothetical protein DXG01_002107 [Tephrocybe rancida]